MLDQSLICNICHQRFTSDWWNQLLYHIVLLLQRSHFFISLRAWSCLILEKFIVDFCLQNFEVSIETFSDIIPHSLFQERFEFFHIKFTIIDTFLMTCSPGIINLFALSHSHHDYMDWIKNHLDLISRFREVIQWLFIFW